MKVMLDTNICIYLIKQQPPSVLERFTDFPVGDVGISIITLAELEYGASKSRHPLRNRLALYQFVTPLEIADSIGMRRPPMEESVLPWKLKAQSSERWIS